MNPMNQSNQNQNQVGGQNGQGGLDQQVQQNLNPNPQNLDPNDPNTAKDPVCGTLVDKRTAPDTIAPAIGTSGPTLYFCSARCKQIFEENPNRFGYADF